MAHEITHVHYEGSARTHESITSYKWKNLDNGTTGASDKPTMVDWIDNKNGIAYVGSGASRVRVGTVSNPHGQRFLRTYSDGTWTNNLLSLPTF